MKILEITAGAAQMYCGSCIRDNALAVELLRQGHDVTLLPLYTPTLTDETNVSDPHVFFGGISVFLEQHSAIFRKTPRVLDRLWDSRWALKLASRHSIAVNPHLLGEMAVSMLRGPDGFQSKEIEKLVAWLRTQPQPDIVTLPNSMLISLAQPIREAVNRPVCCTLQGEDLFLSLLPEPYRTAALDLIRANVDHVAGFAAVSDYYAGFMSRHIGVPASKMHVVPLGINLEGYAPGSRAGAGFTIGYFARVAPEKGLHLLAESYLRLRREKPGTGYVFPGFESGNPETRSLSPVFRLEAAGYLAPEHRDYLDGIERKMKDAGLADEFHYRGVLDCVQKIDFLRSLDILSVPSTYDEPKGIFLLEAMACGVPVVQPRRGAFPEILEKTGGGILVEPDDAASLAEGILSLWKDPAQRAELGRRGAQGVAEHYSVQRMTARALEVYGEISEARVHA